MVRFLYSWAIIGPPMMESDPLWRDLSRSHVIFYGRLIAVIAGCVATMAIIGTGVTKYALIGVFIAFVVMLWVLKLYVRLKDIE